jgi:hypothetical protein
VSIAADIDFAQARLTIERIAKLAEQFAAEAGVGGMETAGNIVSYLAEHPRDIEPFLRFGVLELPDDWHQRGRLTWHAKNGKIVRPEVARRARIIKSLERGS